MATCQKLIQTGTAVVECGRPAIWLCDLPSVYTPQGRLDKRHEYRCDIHREGEAWRVGAA